MARLEGKVFGKEQQFEERVVPVRVFLLGGAGMVGQATAKRLAANAAVSEITIAGRDSEKAKRAASEIGDKANHTKADAMGTAAFEKALGGYDILVNTAGPDYLIQPQAVRAAIEASVHYCDIAADGPSTEDVLSLSEKADDAGITALIGMGSCPGVSNLMMMHAASQLDDVEDVRFYGTLPLADFMEPMLQEGSAKTDESGHVSASLETLMKWFANPTRVFSNGRLTDINPFDSGTTVTLPGGCTLTAYPVNTVEPITIPRYLKAVRSVSVPLCIVPSSLTELTRRVTSEVSAGRMDTRTAVLAFVKEVKEDKGRWLANPENAPLEFIAWASATGIKNGKRGEYTMVWGKEWLSTAAPLSLATLKLLTGEMRKRGVLPPEACFEPMPFMKEVAHSILGESYDKPLFEESFNQLN